MNEKREKHDKHEHRDDKARRRAIEKSLDGVAKAARDAAERRIRAANPGLLDDR